MYNELSGNEDITVWDLTDSIGNKEIDKAVQILDKLLSKGERPFSLLLTIHEHLKKLDKCKLAVIQDKDVAEYLALKPNQTFLIQKYKRHSNNYTEEELYNIIKSFQDLRELYYHTKEKFDLKLGIKTILQSIAEK